MCSIVGQGIAYYSKAANFKYQMILRDKTSLWAIRLSAARITGSDFICWGMVGSSHLCADRRDLGGLRSLLLEKSSSAQIPWGASG